MAWYKSLFRTQSWLIVGFVWTYQSRHCPTLAILEMRKELEPKCVPQLCLGSLLGTSQSAVSQVFSLSQVTIRKSTWPSLLLISKVANYPTFLGVSLIRQQCVQNIQDRYERLTSFQRFDGSQVFVCLLIYLFIYWYSTITGLPFHLRSLTNKLLYLASVVSTLETWIVPWGLDRL